MKNTAWCSRPEAPSLRHQVSERPRLAAATKQFYCEAIDVYFSSLSPPRTREQMVAWLHKMMRWWQCFLVQLNCFLPRVDQILPGYNTVYWSLHQYSICPYKCQHRYRVNESIQTCCWQTTTWEQLTMWSGEELSHVYLDHVSAPRAARHDA